MYHGYNIINLKKKKNRGMDMINSIHALVLLMKNLIIKSCKPKMCNLHIILKFRLKKFQPYLQRR